MDTMSQRTIKAHLVPTVSCRAHWIITFSEFDNCINANLSRNTLHYTRHHLAGILDTIEYRIQDSCQPIVELKGYMWLPIHLMQRQEFCRCAEWVWGVIWRYAELGCIEKCSTGGIPFEELLDKLLECQSNTLFGSGMRRLQIETDTIQGPSRSEGNDQEVESVEFMHRKFGREEAEE
ncbi:hypothetical protein AnigIFM59636_002192 [Aspergillus niger]|nr:hypothetical protein AnigIFM59636_002192 [Aspergillus niger]